MRGSPLIQSLALLLAILTLGFAGKKFIAMDSQTVPVDDLVGITPTEGSTTTDAEIEISFSTPPVSYSLKRLVGEDEVPIFKLSDDIENPSYHECALPDHQVTTYWLDIVWPDAPAENAQHFVRITLSPVNGESGSYSFNTTSAELNETFDYTNANVTKKESHE